MAGKSNCHIGFRMPHGMHIFSIIDRFHGADDKGRGADGSAADDDGADDNDDEDDEDDDDGDDDDADDDDDDDDQMMVRSVISK